MALKYRYDTNLAPSVKNNPDGSATVTCCYFTSEEPDAIIHETLRAELGEAGMRFTSISKETL